MRIAMHKFHKFRITLYLTKCTTVAVWKRCEFASRSNRMAPDKDLEFYERMAVFMSRFKIPKMPSTVNKTIRFPQAIVDQVELELQGTSCNFSQFVIEATRVALENLAEDREMEAGREERQNNSEKDWKRIVLGSDALGFFMDSTEHIKPE